MKKCIFLNQLIATVMFVGLSCAMDQPDFVWSDEKKASERLNLIIGKQGKHKDYKNIYCEEIHPLRRPLQIHFATVAFRAMTDKKYWKDLKVVDMKNNLDYITETMSITNQVRACFNDNLPFPSTDDEIRKVLLDSKKMLLIDNCSSPRESKQSNSADEMTTDNACECMIS